ncbi:cysteine--tRNA ligase [bacterium]|nr:cysteine--tRNA ligase [bacterium]
MSKLVFYNSLTRQKEEFRSINPGEVRLYTCGPTVHDYAHIGNYRAYIFEDLLRRTLTFFGYQVKQVLNITDIDDKTIKKSREQGLSLKSYTDTFTKSFFDDLKTLRIEPAEVYPAATEHIPEMIDLIQKLIDKEHTYTADGSVYFKISTFPDYGKLSNIQPDQLISSARGDSDEYEKEDVRDFALWKAWTEDDGDVFWEAPFGKGRPGWHIECSAMATKYLGTHFDIHTGGVDNKFPHHENGIAQSICGYGGPFVDTWLHCAHLMVNGEKMAKSLGNFYTLREILDAGFSPRVIRYFLLSAHYRQQLNLMYDPETGSHDSFNAAASALERIDEFKAKLADMKQHSAAGDLISRKTTELLDHSRIAFKDALANDLDISGALGVVFGMIKEANKRIASGELSNMDAQAVYERLLRWDEVLGVLEPDQTDEIDAASIEALIAERNQARADKNFARSDEIRDQLLADGIIIQDTPQGTKWRKK